MKTENFTKLIQSITKKDFIVRTVDEEILTDKEYYIYKILPVTKRNIGFKFKTPKNVENLIKSFISQYCKKYKEPNPAHYTGFYCGQYEARNDWKNMTDEQKEFTYFHHSSRMFSEKTLLEQIKENFNNPSIEVDLWRYGFYETVYGIGIFVLFSGQYELNAISKLQTYLKTQNIPFNNEYSNARWVFRFVINIDKNIHAEILKAFIKNQTEINN